MKAKELKNKSKEELEKIFNESCTKLQELRFKVANKQLKNVREIRDLRKTVARIKTLLNQ